MPATTTKEEIEGVYDDERFRRDSFVIGSIAREGYSSNLPVKGEAERGELTLGLSYRFFGRFTTYRNPRSGNVEEQFSFDTFIPVQPMDESGVISYLLDAGKGTGLGPVTAKRAFEKWGDETLKVLRDDPEQLPLISRVSKKQAAELARRLKARQSHERATVDVMQLVSGKRFPKKIVKQSIQTWGNRAAEKIRMDPFRLLRFSGAGFAICDGLWTSLALPQDSVRRQLASAWYKMESDGDGHTWFHRQVLEKNIAQAVGGNAKKAIEFGLRLGRMFPKHYLALAQSEDNQIWLSKAVDAKRESSIARRVVARIKPSDQTAWPDIERMSEVSDHQKAELSKATTGRLGILTGTPGTGKTYATAQLIKAAIDQQRVQPADIIVGAPTGKAAVRMTEALAAVGVPVEARTWHSLLKVMGDDLSGAAHGPGCPWNARLVIGDESSMPDLSLMHAVFSAIPEHACTLLVGDPYQLPPVGTGAPFRDLIRCCRLPHGQLTEVQRNGGAIVQACAMIQKGQPWSTGDNLSIAECDPAVMLDEVIAAIERYTVQGYHPVKHMQVLVPVNTRSPISRHIVNQRLQRYLRIDSAIGNQPFVVGDKVVCTKNGKYVCSDVQIGQIRVANGELAVVKVIEPKRMVVQLMVSGLEITVPTGKQSLGDDSIWNTGCHFDLAYAISGHKSQGSEWPVTIVIADPSPASMRVCSREWIYTAFSRGKEHCHVIGTQKTINQMCRKQAISVRKTLLTESVTEQHAIDVVSRLM